MFPVYLKGPVIPDPSGQLAELIVYITSTRVDLYSHQILLKCCSLLFFHRFMNIRDSWQYNHMDLWSVQGD